MEFSIAPAPHLPRRSRVFDLMRDVLAALLPGILALAAQFGPGVFVQILIAVTAAGLAEAFALSLRSRPVLPALADGSAAVTAVLLAVSLPPLAPWWIGALGAAFAILLGKQAYGGLGFNPFNPAMAAYAMLLVSFPRPMTAWLPPAGLDLHPLDLAATWTAIFSRDLPAGLVFDALAMSTPLDTQKTGLARGLPLDAIHGEALFGAVGGKGWAVVNLAFLAGGLWLWHRRRIAWQIPAGVLAALTGGSLALLLGDPARYASPLFHLFSGATMLGAFFIATDPVTAATAPRGRWLYGLGIGALVLLIREFGGYPDGVAFAVLLMNLTVPTLDRYTRPRIYGARG